MPVRYWSPTGLHRFGAPRLAGAPLSAPPVDAVTVAALLVRETAGGRGDHGADLVARVADSVRRTAAILRDRPARPLRAHGAPAPAREAGAAGTDLFLTAEQALVLGHPLHPTPKSREGLTDAEALRYSPELRGSFPLHWLAVAPPSSRPTRPGPIAAGRSPRPCSPHASPGTGRRHRTGTRSCPCTPGSSVPYGTGRRSRPCWTPD